MIVIGCLSLNFIKPLLSFISNSFRSLLIIDISEVVFSEEKSAFVFEPDFEGNYIDNMLEGMAA